MLPSVATEGTIHHARHPSTCFLQFFKRGEKRAGLRAGQARGKLHDGGMHPQHQKPVPPRIQPPAPPQYVYVLDERQKEPWKAAERAGVALNVMLLLVAGLFAASGGVAFSGQAEAGAVGGLVSGGLLVLLDLVYWIGVVVVFIMLLVHGAAVRAVLMVVVSGICFVLAMMLALGGVVGFLGWAGKEQAAADKQLKPVAAATASAVQDKAMQSGLRRDELLLEISKAAKLSNPVHRQEARSDIMQRSWHGMNPEDGKAVRDAIDIELGPPARPPVRGLGR